MVEHDYIKICKYIAKKLTEHVRANAISESGRHVTYIFVTKPDMNGLFEIDDRYSIDECVNAQVNHMRNISYFRTAKSYFNNMRKRCKKRCINTGYKPYIFDKLFMTSADVLNVQADLMNM